MASLMRFLFYSAIVIHFWAQSGCGVTDYETWKINLVTDAGLYFIDSSLTIRLSVNNNTSNPVYYICSGDIYLEAAADGLVFKDWKVNGFEECLAVRTIEPGAAKEFIFKSQSEYFPFNKENPPNYRLRYRFRADFFTDENAENPLPADQKYSNEFYLISGQK